MADWSVTFRSFSRKCWTSLRPAPGRQSSTAPSGQAGTRGQFSIPARTSSRSIAIRVPSLPGSRWSMNPAGACASSKASFPNSTKAAEQPVDGVVLDIRCVVDAAGRGRARLLPSAPTGRSTCAWPRRGQPPAEIVNSFKVGDLARIIGFLGEERQAGRVARMIERRRTERPFPHHPRKLAEAVEAVLGNNPKTKIPSGDPDVPGPAHLRQ